MPYTTDSSHHTLYTLSQGKKLDALGRVSDAGKF